MVRDAHQKGWLGSASLMCLTGMADMMTRVSSQPWMKALIKLAKKIVTKNRNIPIFSPMPSCSLLRSLNEADGCASLCKSS